MTPQKHHLPRSVSIVPVAFVLGLAGCALTAFAEAPQTSAPAAAPAPGATSVAAPTSSARPPRIVPPRLVAEAGILPTNPLSTFDRLDEWVERTIFSFGLPSLRTRILLAQAAERIAELQALERTGGVTPALIKKLLERHGALLEVANQIVARQITRGVVSADLLLTVVRTRVAAAEVLEEQAVEQRSLEDLDRDEPAAIAEEEGERAEQGTASIADRLEATAEHLMEFEAVLDLSAPKPALPPDVFLFIAEQKIAKAERDLLRAGQVAEDRRVQGMILVAEVELRRGAGAALAAAHELLAAGNFPEALSFAGQARTFARRLQSGKIAVQLDAEKSREYADRILDDLLESGLISVADRAAAAERARAVIDQVRQQPGSGSG